MMIERSRFEEIMADDDIGGVNLGNGCNAVRGLNIIRKYLPEEGIEGAGHDIIYSVDVHKIIRAGITENDVLELRKENWMIDQDSLACFV